MVRLPHYSVSAQDLRNPELAWGTEVTKLYNVSIILKEVGRLAKLRFTLTK